MEIRLHNFFTDLMQKEAEKKDLDSYQYDFHQTGQLNIAHAVVAFEAHNDKTNEQAIFELNQFKRCTDLAMHVEGSPRYINQFLQTLNTDKIFRLIVD